MTILTKVPKIRKTWDKDCACTVFGKLDLIFEEDRRIDFMKKVIALSAVLVMGALGMACGDAASNANGNANKSAMNAMNSAVNAANSAANAMANAANAMANTANSMANAANAMANKPANAMAPNANSNVKKP